MLRFPIGHALRTLGIVGAQRSTLLHHHHETTTGLADNLHAVFSHFIGIGDDIPRLFLAVAIEEGCKDAWFPDVSAESGIVEGEVFIRTIDACHIPNVTLTSCHDDALAGVT